MMIGTAAILPLLACRDRTGGRIPDPARRGFCAEAPEAAPAFEAGCTMARRVAPAQLAASHVQEAADAFPGRRAVPGGNLLGRHAAGPRTSRPERRRAARA